MYALQSGERLLFNDAENEGSMSGAGDIVKAAT
jgi:hypothetical protein